MAPEKIESLWHEIQDRRLTNTARKEFVPANWLSDLLSEERLLEVLEALDEGAIDKDECPQVARDIRRFGLKTFAISLKKPHLVYRFFQTDQFDPDTCSLLDKRLPMEEAKLKHALGLEIIQKDTQKLSEDAKQKGLVLDSDPKFMKLKEREAERMNMCREFLSVQDMFLSPTFPQGPLHCLLLDSTRLPFFLHPEKGGTADSGAADPPQGAFGKVNKEILPPPRYGDKYVVEETPGREATGKLKHVVEKWMDFLAEGLACDGKTALGELLNLVRKRLLVVELPPHMGMTAYVKN
ncbi:hypothetical protein B0T24DRAFT_674549 [Lasiosphaeria ovina]|uniref:Uncharacterized protein n=1 Tax=Lasiosphaeria ovina TaxID=92902 RepID=A0AAE0NCA0_9PEZI|nr:hypothetical protein B0T24DRAFT_674549 [Lasiosphaeria ovina]